MTQIIRTYEELKNLDPDSILASIEEIYMPAHDWVNDYHIEPHEVFPVALIADGEQVRAARHALSEALE